LKFVVKGNYTFLVKNIYQRWFRKEVQNPYSLQDRNL